MYYLLDPQDRPHAADGDDRRRLGAVVLREVECETNPAMLVAAMIFFRPVGRARVVAHEGGCR
jgi:hypothetical protein